MYVALASFVSRHGDLRFNFFHFARTHFKIVVHAPSFSPGKINAFTVQNDIEASKENLLHKGQIDWATVSCPDTVIVKNFLGHFDRLRAQ